MDYGMIGKIEKAKRYAEEPERFQFSHFSVQFNGDHDHHEVSYDNGKWACDCEFFIGREVCSHTMALENLLENMIGVKEGA